MSPTAWARTGIVAMVTVMTIGDMVFVGLPWWGSLLIAVIAVIAKRLVVAG